MIRVGNLITKGGLGVAAAMMVVACDDGEEGEMGHASLRSGASSVTLEAEHGTISSGGSGLINQGSKVLFLDPGSLCWTQEAYGTTDAKVYYGNGEPWSEQMSLTVDGVTVASLTLAQGGGWEQPTATATGSFEGTGTHEVCLVASTESSGDLIAAVDKLEFTSAGGSAPAPAATTTTLQAELGSLSSGTGVQAQGDKVLFMDTGSVCWTQSLSGATEAVLYYGNGESSTEQMQLTVGSSFRATLSLPTAGGWDSYTGTARTSFNATGTQTICLEASAEAAGGWIAAVDRIELSSGDESPTTPVSVQVDPNTSPVVGSPASAGGCAGTSAVATSDYDLCVDGQDFIVKGINYDPQEEETCATTPFYETYAFDDLFDSGEGDAAAIAGMNANTVRIYGPLSKAITSSDCTSEGLCWMTSAHLDEIQNKGMKVIIGVSSWWDFQARIHVDMVSRYVNHPAVIGMMMGNEMNFNKLYYQPYKDEGRASNLLVDEIDIYIAQARAAGWTKPIILGWGHPAEADRAPLRSTDADIIAYQLYEGLDFQTSNGQTVFDWHRSTFDGVSASKLPGMITEYGADAWNGNIGAEDQASQAYANGVLTELIKADALSGPSGFAGGILFTWADNWGKSLETAGQNGDSCRHDVGGVPVLQGSGPHPDSVFHEKWWGQLARDRTPRQAYSTMRDIYATY